MAAFQKINHLRVERLAIAGTELAPIEAPAYPDEDATLTELGEAFVDLIARLTDAGVFIVTQPQEEPTDTPDGDPAN